MEPNGYNMTSGGETNKEICIETRLKMSISASKRIASEETKTKISEAGKGRIHTEETKEKLRQINLGKFHTEETKEKLRLINLGKTLLDDTKEKLRIASTGKKHKEDSKEKVSNDKRRKGIEENLPMYISKLLENPKEGMSSGYKVSYPNNPSKTFTSIKLSNEEKLKLALEYLKELKDKCSTTISL